MKKTQKVEKLNALFWLFLLMIIAVSATLKAAAQAHYKNKRANKTFCAQKARFLTQFLAFSAKWLFNVGSNHL